MRFSPLRLARSLYHSSNSVLATALSYKKTCIAGVSSAAAATTQYVRDNSTMATSAGSEDDVRSRGQQPMLASQRAKQARDKSADSAGQPKPALFPLGYKDAVSQWWSGLSPAATENAVLSFVPYLQKPPTHTLTGSAPISAKASQTSISTDAKRQAEPVTTSSLDDPYGPRRWHSNLVQLSGHDRALNEFSVERIGEEVDNNLVMIHGYGAGLGFFYRNFEGLSRLPGWKLYALDLLGMGRSSRPNFRIHAKDRQGKITEAENWFVDALEEWRIKRNIDRFTLLGHSLGGYLGVAYALKYPGHLKKLILASPVGIPEDPYAVNAELPEPGDSTLANELTQDQNETMNGTNPDIPASAKTGDNNNFLNARKNAKPSDSEDGKPQRKPLSKVFTYLWDANISPFSLVRWSGPLGPRLVSGWTSRRFNQFPEAESQALHDYSYSLFKQKGSGEYALAYILAPGAFARSPLIRRIQGVGRQYLGTHSGPIADADNPSAPSAHEGERKRESGIPIVMLYGENDWMDVAGGYASKEKVDYTKERLLAGKSEEERKRDNGDCNVYIIGKAGHHVYLDGWEQFNDIIRKELSDVEKRERRLAN